MEIESTDVTVGAACVPPILITDTLSEALFATYR